MLLPIHGFGDTMTSDAVRIARLSASTQLTAQLLAVTTDPLWSTVLGFVAVHELRKRDLIGPVADDILYAGMIAINTARTPGLAGMVGSALGLENVVLPAAAGAIGAKVFGQAAGGAAAGTVAGGVAKKSLMTRALPAAKVVLPLAITAAVMAKTDAEIYKRLSKADKKAWRKVPIWKRLIPFYGQAAIREAQRKVAQEGT
jgi:hypothetical protein